MCVPVWLFRIGHRRSCHLLDRWARVAGSATYLIILADNLVAHGKTAILEKSSVQDVARVYLHVGDLEFGNTIDEDLARVIFLTTLLGVEVCPIENQADLFSLWQLLGGGMEVVGMIDGFDIGRDVSTVCTKSAGRPSSGGR